MSYHNTHPEQDIEDVAGLLFAAGWEDWSYHNDTAPFFVAPDRTMGVWVNGSDRQTRDVADMDRFLVCRLIPVGQAYEHPDEHETLFSDESIEALRAFLKI